MMMRHLELMKKMMSEEYSREGYHKAKKEGGAGAGASGSATINNITDKFSTSRQWPGFRNPRIVRVSRSLGGKDRHSKVCTIRGLRDRRIRLSVPTALQLYELQDRLGLTQPSKVIDWLLEATKCDIDKLPPLQIPHGFPHQFHHQTLLPYHHEPSISLQYSSLDAISRLRGKEDEKGKWVKVTEEDGHGMSGYSSSGLVNLGQYTYNNNNNNNNSNNFYHLEPASLSLSQCGSHHHGLLFPSHTEYASPISSGNVVQFSPLSHQLLFCPSSSSGTPAFLAPHHQVFATSAEESDPRGQFSNHVQFLSSSSSQVLQPSFLHSMNSPLKPLSSKLPDSDNSHRSHPPDKEITRS